MNGIKMDLEDFKELDLTASNPEKHL